MRTLEGQITHVHSAASSPWLQEDVREIVEAYDELVHGALDAPAVRDEVHRQRQYFGPPRSEAERCAQAQALADARRLVEQTAADEQAAGSAAASEAAAREECTRGPEPRELPLTGLQVYQEAGPGADSDDDSQDAAPGAPEQSTAGAGGLAADEEAWDEEVERLAAAFENAGAAEERCVAHAAHASCDGAARAHGLACIARQRVRQGRGRPSSPRVAQPVAALPGSHPGVAA